MSSSNNQRSFSVTLSIKNRKQRKTQHIKARDSFIDHRRRIKTKDQKPNVLISYVKLFQSPTIREHKQQNFNQSFFNGIKKDVIQKYSGKNISKNIAKFDKENKNKQSKRVNRMSMQNINRISFQRWKNKLNNQQQIKQQIHNNETVESISIDYSWYAKGQKKWLKLYYLERLIYIIAKSSIQTNSQLQKDINILKNVFLDNLKINEETCIFRGLIFILKTDIAKLLFFIGLQLQQLIKKIQIPEFSLIKITQCLHHQVYYGLIFKISELAIQSLIECARIHTQYKKFQEAEYFCSVALCISIYHSHKYYQELALQQISICQYKIGNIQKAKQIHKNISNLSFWSKKQITLQYDQKNYLKQLSNYLFQGMKLKMKQKNKLIFLLKFDQIILKQQNDFNNKQTHHKYLVKMRRSINNFHLQQLRINDLQLKSNERAIQQIKQKLIVQTKEDQIRKQRRRSEKSLNSMIFFTHESLNRRQDRNKRNSKAHVQKYINNFNDFLRYMVIYIQNLWKGKVRMDKRA